MSFIFNNIGICYSALGNFDRAIEFVNRARSVAEKSNFRPRAENSFAILGDLEIKRGHFDAAGNNFEQSLNLAHELRDVPGEAQATLGLAQVAFAKNDTESALHQAEDATELYRKLQGRTELAEALTLSGRCLVRLHREDEARRSFWAAMGAIEDVRGRVAGGEVEREVFFARELAPYHELISLFVRQNRNAEALAIAERASARVLLDITSGSRTALAGVLNPDEQKERTELETKLASIDRDLERLRIADNRDGAAIAKAENQRSEWLEQRQDFEARVASRHPELRRVAASSTLTSLRELTPLFSHHVDTLLRYVVTDREAFLFVVRREPQDEPKLTVVSIAKGRRELARLTNDFRSRLVERSLAWEKPAGDLYDLLLRPVEKQLGDSNSILIVPDGPLWELPFQVLERDPDRPLLVERSVRYAPSLTLLGRLEQTKIETMREPELLAFVNPALRQKGDATAEMTKIALMEEPWQPLPQLEKQVSELKKIYPPPAGKVFAGASASEHTFKQLAAEAGILHFAMHGVLDDRAPLYSYLVFSQINNEPEEDGRLETRELLQLQLHARLAVLCGCETARGQVTAGAGVVGLSWGFMVAGCPATIVSQWKVDSASSTPLMVELHRQLHDGVESAEALRHASLTLRNDSRYRHPFYWAPFVLVGASL